MSLRPTWAKLVIPYLESKNYKPKGWGVAQVVEFLPSKLEALGSMPSPHLVTPSKRKEHGCRSGMFQLDLKNLLTMLK
jgi:hypothetical protein